jgi:hypothetical protein
MQWNKPRLIQQLRKLYRSKEDLSYNAMCRNSQALVSAAAYHFGSYRRAVLAADLDYAAIMRRPRWTKQAVIQEIKKGYRKGEDLNWSSVTKRRDELGHAAFAALQPRLFGRWDKALQAAGLDPDEISRYRHWGIPNILYELRRRKREGEPLNSGALQHEDPGLHAAAVRNYKTFDDALRAAGINPQRVRQRRVWTKKEVLAALKKQMNGPRAMGNSDLREHEPALYGAAVRLYGTFSAARKAAGLPPGRRGRRTPFQAAKARATKRK